MSIGYRILKEQIIKKRISSDEFFRKLLAGYGNKLSKKQFREVVKKEGMPLTMPQIDLLFKRLDLNHDGFLD